MAYYYMGYTPDALEDEDPDVRRDAQQYYDELSSKTKQRIILKLSILILTSFALGAIFQHYFQPL